MLCGGIGLLQLSPLGLYAATLIQRPLPYGTAK